MTRWKACILGALLLPRQPPRNLPQIQTIVRPRPRQGLAGLLAHKTRVTPQSDPRSNANDHATISCSHALLIHPCRLCPQKMISGILAASAAFQASPLAPPPLSQVMPRAGAPVAFFGNKDVEGKVVPTGGFELPGGLELPAFELPAVPDNVKALLGVNGPQNTEVKSDGSRVVRPAKNNMEFDDYGRLVKGRKVPKDQKYANLKLVSTKEEKNEEGILLSKLWKP